jgi:hypothetical protein
MTIDNDTRGGDDEVELQMMVITVRPLSLGWRAPFLG